VHPLWFLSLGLRYETPGNALASLFPVNDASRQPMAATPCFSSIPGPADLNNFQPRSASVGIRDRDDGWCGFSLGGIGSSSSGG